MGYPYLGDHQLEPEDEFECMHCHSVFSTNAKMVMHVMRCPKNEEIEATEPYPEEEV